MGHAKKCLILDCDNTLWGGVIGEDGLKGINLSPSEYPGCIYYEFQQTLLHLYERGVLLCLCSKNNEKDVFQVLEEHPHSLIQKKHLAAWQINWKDKGTNIKTLSTELKLNPDSFVFVDDSQNECEWVKNCFSEMEVLQVPSDLPLFPKLLLHHGWFDTLAFTEEDKKRTHLYQSERLRTSTRKKYENLDDYLKSLNLELAVHAMEDEETTRVAQLTQKTNQFNLTTKRYSERDIKQFQQDPKARIYTMSARDRFGDYGLTGVLIAVLKDKTAHIDSFLLSCRVLGRNLEYAFLDFCLGELKTHWKMDSWQAKFIPTAKNEQVSDFWTRIGFGETGSNEKGHKEYEMKTTGRKAKKYSYIKMNRFFKDRYSNQAE